MIFNFNKCDKFAKTNANQQIFELCVPYFNQNELRKRINQILILDLKPYNFMFLFMDQFANLSILPQRLQPTCKYYLNTLSKSINNSQKTTHSKIFNDIYCQTCLIISYSIFQQFEEVIISHIFIKKIFIIFDNSNQKIKSNSKIVILQKQDLSTYFSLDIADNFIVQESIKNPFINNIMNILKQQMSLQNQANNIQLYLRVLDYTEQESSSFVKSIMSSKIDVLRLYTMNQIFYFVNCVLRRCYQMSILTRIRYIIYNLHQSISKGSYLIGNKICYRGGSISKREVEWLLTKINQFVICRYFMSCSMSFWQANKFRVNCIFQIRFNNKGYTLLQNRSEFREQEEVLFNILSRFRVLQVNQDRTRRDKGWYIVLEYSQKQNEDTK